MVSWGNWEVSLKPDDVEKTIADTSFFFKDSPVRHDEFKKLKEIVEPDNPHVSIVQYHKVRWLYACSLDHLTLDEASGLPT